MYVKYVRTVVTHRTSSPKSLSSGFSCTNPRLSMSLGTMAPNPDRTYSEKEEDEEEEEEETVVDHSRRRATATVTADSSNIVCSCRDSVGHCANRQWFIWERSHSSQKIGLLQMGGELQGKSLFQNELK